MIKLNFELGAYIMKYHYDKFGYLCNEGAVIGDDEFIIYSDDCDYWLVHKSELEQKGVFVRIKEKDAG